MIAKGEQGDSDVDENEVLAKEVEQREDLAETGASMLVKPSGRRNRELYLSSFTCLVCT